MKEKKYQLLIDNSEELDKLRGLFGPRNAFRKYNALELMVKDKTVMDSGRVKEAIKIVRKNTLISSSFRKNNLLTVAVTISFEEDMEGALKEILYIHKCLINQYRLNEYAIFAALAIFNERYRIDIDTTVNNTIFVYESMRERYKFLTLSEDIVVAAIIAIISKNLEMTINEIGECYELLKKNGFKEGNKLESLAHMMVLFDGTVEDKVAKVIKIRNALNEKDFPIKGWYISLLAIAACCMENADSFASEVSEVSKKLKGEKGFGVVSLQSDIRNMFSIMVVASSYAEKSNDNVCLAVKMAVEKVAVITSEIIKTCDGK